MPDSAGRQNAGVSCPGLQKISGTVQERFPTMIHDTSVSAKQGAALMAFQRAWKG